MSNISDDILNQKQLINELFMGNRQSMINFLKMVEVENFHEDGLIFKLIAAYQTKNIEQFKLHAHSLKGNGGYFYSKTLSTKAAEAQKAADDQIKAFGANLDYQIRWDEIHHVYLGLLPIVQQVHKRILTILDDDQSKVIQLKHEYYNQEEQESTDHSLSESDLDSCQFSDNFELSSKTKSQQQFIEKKTKSQPQSGEKKVAQQQHVSQRSQKQKSIAIKNVIDKHVPVKHINLPPLTPLLSKQSKSTLPSENKVKQSKQRPKSHRSQAESSLITSDPNYKGKSQSNRSKLSSRRSQENILDSNLALEEKKTEDVENKVSSKQFGSFADETSSNFSCNFIKLQALKYKKQQIIAKQVQKDEFDDKHLFNTQSVMEDDLILQKVKQIKNVANINQLKKKAKPKQKSQQSPKYSQKPKKKLNYNDLFRYPKKSKKENLEETEWVVKSTKEYMQSMKSGEHQKKIEEIQQQLYHDTKIDKDLRVSNDAKDAQNQSQQFKVKKSVQQQSVNPKINSIKKKQQGKKKKSKKYKKQRETINMYLKGKGKNKQRKKRRTEKEEEEEIQIIDKTTTQCFTKPLLYQRSYERISGSQNQGLILPKVQTNQVVKSIIKQDEKYCLKKQQKFRKDQRKSDSIHNFFKGQYSIKDLQSNAKLGYDGFEKDSDSDSEEDLFINSNLKCQLI